MVRLMLDPGLMLLNWILDPICAIECYDIAHFSVYGVWGGAQRTVYGITFLAFEQ